MISRVEDPLNCALSPPVCGIVQAQRASTNLLLGCQHRETCYIDYLSTEAFSIVRRNIYSHQEALPNGIMLPTSDTSSSPSAVEGSIANFIFLPSDIRARRTSI
jgi:hypothetical protein